MKRSKSNIYEEGFFLDRNFSGALKGVGVVFILMGHFAQMNIDIYKEEVKSINWIIAWSTANIGLVWFMFISGYGLTVKKQKIDNYIATFLNRICKVFFPMLFVFLVSLFVYCFIPYPYTPNEATLFHIPTEIGMLPSHFYSNIGFITSQIINWYWYSWCAIMLYICFYIAYYLSDRFSVDKSYALFAILAIYYIGAFFILGPSYGRYYRLVWAFFLGHLFVRKDKLTSKSFYIMAILAISTLFFETTLMIISFAAGLIGIVLCSKLNKKYTFNSRPLIFLGTISYFYYLCHRRIVWVLLCNFHVHDLLTWAILSIIIAYLLYSLYNPIMKIVNNWFTSIN